MQYKDSKNKLYSLSDADIASGGEKLLPADCVAITAQEAAALQVVVPTPEQLAAAAQAAKDAAEALAAKQDAFVTTVAGFTMAQVDSFVDTNFATFTAPQKNFLKAVGKVCVIGARKL